MSITTCTNPSVTYPSAINLDRHPLNKNALPREPRRINVRVDLAKNPRLIEHMTAKGVLITSEIRHLPEKEREQAMRWVAKALHCEFKRNDKRYRTLKSTIDVVRKRVVSDDPNARIYVSLIRYKDSYGQDAAVPVATASIVPLDDPPMPEYGNGFIADLVTRKEYQGWGLITNLYTNHLLPAAKRGLRLYAELQNTGLYVKKFKMHEVERRTIPDQENPGKEIPVTVFSSMPLRRKADICSISTENALWEPFTT